ncbi:T9SS type A sorting domain-containing protein [bacterium]|nr:T9SS type A sorting domain-containing protein [bacterium]
MKHLILFITLVCLLSSPSVAQHWEWEWVNLTPNGTPTDSLLGKAVDCLTLEGESAPRFVVMEEEGTSAIMVYDDDTRPASHNWVTRPLMIDLPDEVGYGSFQRHLMAAGSQIRYVHVLPGDQQDTLITSLYDPAGETVEWVLDRSYYLTGEDFEIYTVGDFDGDGLFDYAIQRYDTNEVTVHFQTDGVEPLTATVVAGEVAYGIYALDIDDDGQDELFCQRWTYQMHTVPLLDGCCLLAATPDSVLIVTADPTRQFFVADINGDGSDEVLSTDHRTLLEGSVGGTMYPLTFTPERAWSPPYKLWMPLELDEINTPVRFLSAGITGPWYSSDETLPSIRAPYCMWSANPDGESYTLHGIPIYTHGANATSLPLDNTENRALILSGISESVPISYTFKTKVWMPPANDDEPWQLQNDYSQTLYGFENPRLGGYGDIFGDGRLDYISYYNGTLYEQTWNGEEWVTGRSWVLSEDIPQPTFKMLVSDIDGNTTPDLVYNDNQALICIRRLDGTTFWEHAEPFADVGPLPASSPLSAYDVNLDGTQDLYFGNGVLLLNHSWNGVEDPTVEATRPGTFTITSISPNPFNPTTTITLDLPRAGHLRVAVYDLLGRQVAVLQDGTVPSGRRDALFDGSRLASGVYLVRATYKYHDTRTVKMILMK